MIDPKTVMVAIPSHSGTNVCELTGSLVASSGLFGALSLKSEGALLPLVRNIIAETFLRSNFEWLVCIDADIAFSPQDLQFLLEPCNGTAVADSPQPTWPTRTTVSQITGRDPHTGEVLRMMGAADILVTAEYPYKNESGEAVRQGFGFNRIHRSVFERLIDLKHDGGATVEVRRDLFEQIRACVAKGDSAPHALLQQLIETHEDQAGRPRLWQAMYQGALIHDFFPVGAALALQIPDAQWTGEDHGFFTLCRLAGITPRIEQRTRLTHIGRKGYHYDPHVGGAQ